MTCMRSAANVRWPKSIESSKSHNGTSPKLSWEPVAEKSSTLPVRLPLT